MYVYILRHYLYICTASLIVHYTCAFILRHYQTNIEKAKIKTSAGLPGEIFLTNTRKISFLSFSYVDTGGDV
jgi:hypothetical protein